MEWPYFGQWTIYSLWVDLLEMMTSLLEISWTWLFTVIWKDLEQFTWILQTIVLERVKLLSTLLFHVKGVLQEFTLYMQRFGMLQKGLQRSVLFHAPGKPWLFPWWFPRLVDSRWTLGGVLSMMVKSTLSPHKLSIRNIRFPLKFVHF